MQIFKSLAFHFVATRVVQKVKLTYRLTERLQFIQESCPSSVSGDPNLHPPFVQIVGGIRKFYKFHGSCILDQYLKNLHNYNVIRFYKSKA